MTSSNFAWNHIVALTRRYYRLYHKGVSTGQMQKHMAKLAKHNTFWSKLGSQSMQELCQRYQTALDRHFKLHAGFPRPKKKFIGGSVVYKQGVGYTLGVNPNNPKQGLLTINKLGKNHVFKYKRTVEYGDIRRIMIKRDTDNKLYLIVTSMDFILPYKRDDNRSIGMDFGMKTFLTCSDGEKIDIPDYHKQSLRESSAADRSYWLKRNAKVYGTSFKRAKRKMQRIKRKVADRRADFHWKLAHKLCKQNAVICMETLNIKAMQKHKRWGRKISSLGFSEFVRKLEVVAQKYGTEIRKIDRFAATSQLCSVCGYKYSGTKELSVRKWKCPVCGTMHDRDVNAAVNILNIGLGNIKTEHGEDVPRGGRDSKPSVSVDADAVSQNG